MYTKPHNCSTNRRQRKIHINVKPFKHAHSITVRCELVKLIIEFTSVVWIPKNYAQKFALKFFTFGSHTYLNS